MYRTCERSFHEKKLLNATLLFYEGWQRNKGEFIPLETRGTRSLFQGSACPDEKIQRFLDKSMVRTFLNRCNIYISIRLIFNTTNVRPSIYYLILAGKWTRNFDRSIVLASSFVYSTVCYCPIHLKYTKQLRRNVVHYLRKEICFSEYIYVYIQWRASPWQKWGEKKFVRPRGMGRAGRWRDPGQIQRDGIPNCKYIIPSVRAGLYSCFFIADSGVFYP